MKGFYALSRLYLKADFCLPPLVVVWRMWCLDAITNDVAGPHC